jgi:hypothetical protein
MLSELKPGGMAITAAFLTKAPEYECMRYYEKI